MRFWDTSAIIPLILTEATTDGVRQLYRDDPNMSVWWATAVECHSALARRGRETRLDPSAIQAASDELSSYRVSWGEVQPAESIRSGAIRLVRIHDLRAADALQLSAALTLANRQPEVLDFVCLDGKLRNAAQVEGLRVIVPGVAL